MELWNVFSVVFYSILVSLVFIVIVNYKPLKYYMIMIALALDIKYKKKPKNMSFIDRYVESKVNPIGNERICC